MMIAITRLITKNKETMFTVALVVRDLEHYNSRPSKALKM
jgi:hypothetical protein